MKNQSGDNDSTSPITFKGFELNSFQTQSVRAIESGENLLVSAPTGAGKTLIAEYAIEAAAKKGRRCIYTSPIKALSNQKYRDFRDDPNIDVGIMTGDVTIHPDAKVLIMTTEILRNTLFEDPARLHDVEYVIFDEIHYMDNQDRGTVWEESIIFLPDSIRLVGLSATISNIKQFGAWIRKIRKQPLKIVTSTKRPVPLKHQCYHVVQGIFPAKQHRKVRWKSGKRKGHGRGRDSKGLIDFVVEEKQLPCLYFCFSRRDCERMAHRNQKRHLLNVEERIKMQNLFQEVCESFELEMDPDVNRLYDYALNGVGFHHAGMLPLHKELVERLFTSGMLKLLFTTETFAMGINMPAKTVIFDALRKFDGVNFNYLMTRDYMQMAGRAGRQGIDTEGLVYGVLDNKDLRFAPVDRIINGKVEPIRSKFNLSYSTLLNLFEHMRGRIFEAWEKSFNSFQGADRSPKQNQRNKNKQLLSIQRRLDLLGEMGYLDEKQLLDRGHTAKQINGYELQVTQYLFEGVLERLDPHQINALFSATVFEPRRADQFDKPDPTILGEGKSHVRKVIRDILKTEESYNIAGMSKIPCFDIMGVAHAWSQGEEFERLFAMTNLAPGDLVRTFRLTHQLLRQLRKSLPKKYDLSQKLSEAMNYLNRDVVDARRQLELG